MKAVGESTRRRIYSYSNTAITAEVLNINGAPLQFHSIKYAGEFASEFRIGDGAFSSSSPGMLVGRILRDSLGRMSIETDRFGRETKYFYNTDLSCQNVSGGPGPLPTPTCIEANGLRTTITRGTDLLPTRLSVSSNSGGNVIKELIWDGANLKSIIIKDSQGRITSSINSDFQGAFPTTETTTETIYFDEYDTTKNGRVRKITEPSGFQKVYAYQANGQVSSLAILGLSTTYSKIQATNGSTVVRTQGDGVVDTINSNYLATEIVGARIGASSALSVAERIEQQITLLQGMASVIETKRSTATGGKLTSREESRSVLDPISGEFSTLGKYELNLP